MELFTFTGAVLLALLVMVLPALAHKQHWNVIREDWRYPLRILFGVLTGETGTILINYYVRGGNTLINGSATAPTAAQASQVMKQVAVIQFGAAADPAFALFTHNWGLDASAPTYFSPEVIMEPISSTTSWPMISFWRANTNVLQVMRPVSDTPTTIVVTLRRPHSIGQ